MIPAQGSKTTQGYELQQGTNNLGHFLFAKLLTPTLVESAKTAPKNSVRIVWVSSSAADFAPKPAIDFDNMDYAKDESRFTKYSRSKAGNAIHSCEFSRRYADSGVISLVSKQCPLTHPYYTDAVRCMFEMTSPHPSIVRVPSGPHWALACMHTQTARIYPSHFANCGATK